jgi:hypothetical protein
MDGKVAGRSHKLLDAEHKLRCGVQPRCKQRAQAESGAVGLGESRALPASAHLLFGDTISLRPNGCQILSRSCMLALSIGLSHSLTCLFLKLTRASPNSTTRWHDEDADLRTHGPKRAQRTVSLCRVQRAVSLRNALMAYDSTSSSRSSHCSPRVFALLSPNAQITSASVVAARSILLAFKADRP